MQTRMEVYKIDGDPAATDAHDAQVHDAPVRPTVAENATANKGEQDLPPEDAGAQRCNDATKDTVESSEEQHAEEEPQGEPDPPA